MDIRHVVLMPIACALVFSLANYAEAQTYTGVLVLDPIASKINTGSTVIFSGQLSTTSGHAIQDATIYIKDDVSFGRDDVIGTLTTDDNGEFYGTWTAQPRSSGAWDFYAEYEGSSQVTEARSATYSVQISSSGSTHVTLDRIPSSVYAGDSVTFTGTLTSGGSPLSGRTVWIYEDDFGPDDPLASGTTDNAGRFSIKWTANAGTVNTGSEEIYAKFFGDGQHSGDESPRQTTSVYDKRGSSLTLDPIPNRVYAGDTVTFTGTLTGGGSPLSGRTVAIYDDDTLRPDDYLARGTTDNAGRFSIDWKVEAGTVEIEFDIYAEFDGDGKYSDDQSRRQPMNVYKRGGSLTLDPIQTSAALGEAIPLSGTLMLDGRSPEGSIVYIKDDDTLGFDDLLATAYVDSSGRFATYWIVEDVDTFDYTIEIQAVFEGDDLYRRLATPIEELDIDPLAPAPGPTDPLAPAPGPTEGEGYMELYYSLDFERAPRMLIVPSPYSYDEVREYIYPVREGIQLLTSMLEQEYGDGNWNVGVEVVAPGERTTHKPDIIVNVVTSDDDYECRDTVLGYALLTGHKPVQAAVCYKDGRTNKDVEATAVHEFIHAVGVGHTFNIRGDRMCSVEDGVPTCPDLRSRSKTPSGLNLAAIVAIYGTDGFQNPNNNHVSWGEKLTVADYRSNKHLSSLQNQNSPAAVTGFDATPTAPIGAPMPPLERVFVPDLWIMDVSGNALDTISTNQQVQIASGLTNRQDRTQTFVYLVQISDSDGITMALAGISGTLEAGQTLRPSVSWVPTEAGTYSATAFVWESADNPAALSPPVTSTVIVTFPPLTTEPPVTSDPPAPRGPEPNQDVPRTPTDTIEPMPGSSTVGCEATIEGCSIPGILTVDPGTAITFMNTDDAAHTLTAGTAIDGLSGTFDSGLVMPGGSYTFSLDSSGTYDWYCLVHPWRTGQIIVGDPPAPRGPEPNQDVPRTPTDTIEPMPGSSTVGCEATIEGCSIPGILTVDPGTAITFMNTDDAAHTLTAGTAIDGLSGTFDSGLVMPGGSYTFSLDSSGTYDWYCLVHPWRTGQIIVGDPPAPRGPEPNQDVPRTPTDTIEPMPGSSTVGCEATIEGCSIPGILTVDPGTAITFMNTDDAAHTLTAGTAIDGLSGTFDSGLVMPGGSYTFSLDSSGTYDWYCLVHPWRTGQIIVE